MTAQAQEDLERIREISARAATVAPELIREGNVVYLQAQAQIPDDDAERIRRTVAKIDDWMGSGFCDLGELRAMLTGKRSRGVF